MKTNFSGSGPCAASMILCAALFFTAIGCAVPCGTASAQEIQLNYSPAPIDNPLKGLVPYWGQANLKDSFPCSVEFHYFPLNELLTGENTYDWSPVEAFLNSTSSKGRHATFRVYAEFPGQPIAVPQYLIDAGVQIHEYQAQGGDCFTPDYNDPRVQTAILNFIAALGKEYDNDPRVGFLTAGLLGHWGEWHSYPQSQLFPGKEFQEEVLTAFDGAFPNTFIHLRYPANDDEPTYTANHNRNFGYHDDSFAFATMPTGDSGDSWFYLALAETAGPLAVNKWKTHMIGGEIRPEVWGCVFDSPGCTPEGQEFERCVAATHVSWLMDSGMFDNASDPPTAARIAEATKQVRKMGYELHVSRAVIEMNSNQLALKLSVVNKGVAPFYRDWPVEVVVTAKDGSQHSFPTDWRLSTILPGDNATESNDDALIDSDQWQVELELPADATPVESVGIRVVSPLQNGRPLRFANETQQENGLLIIE